MKPRYGYGFHINSTDYRVYLKVPTHPHRNSGGYVLLSRLIAEHILGRYLSPKEKVHHIDNNSCNNHPKNLQVFDHQGEHVTLHNMQKEFNPNLRRLRDKTWLENEYLNKGKSLEKIAIELGCCRATVRRRLKKHSIPLRRYSMTLEAQEARQKGADSRKPKGNII